VAGLLLALAEPITVTFRVRDGINEVVRLRDAGG
jgi:hypothetical protein